MSKKQQTTVLIELDKRTTRKDGTHPVKLRIYDPETRKRKRYGTKFYLTASDFSESWERTRIKKAYQEINLKLKALETKASDIVQKLDPFTFEDFERIMFNKHTGGKRNVNFYFDTIIEDKIKKGKISSANSYKNAFDSLLRFHGKPSIDFKQINVSFLEQWEKHWIEKENNSIAGIGVYLRNLRAVFNQAIEDEVINPKMYPFGKKKKKYNIQTAKKRKIALSKDEIKILFNGTPQNEHQAKAKAFWFFSYLCNGMNTKDIVNLKYKDLENDYFIFERAKTDKTTTVLESIKVFLHPFAKEVIEKYGNPSKSPNNYIFEVLEKGMSDIEQKRKKDNFNRYINQHIEPYAKSLGIDKNITVLVARHSFSTILARGGQSVALISEALGHTNIKTTQNYLDGFEDEAKKGILNDLL